MARTIHTREKRHKASDGEQDMPSIDRLSALPDVVICHILSFLPTKTSAKTSILAKRWRSLWAHVPNLNFQFEEDEHYTYLHHNIKIFLKIVAKVTSSLYEVKSMNNFRLSTTKDSRCNRKVEKCITGAIVRNVKNIDLSCSDLRGLPRCLLTCKTLISLRLHGCLTIPMSGDVFLPALKKLHLDCVLYEDDKSLPHILSGCPVLEELKIDLKKMDTDCICISSPTLIRLVLDTSSKVVNRFYIETYRVKINTPVLKYLQLHGSISEIVSTGGALPSLIEADITLERVCYPRNLIDFVGRLCNVKRLKLSSGCMDVPNSTFSSLAIRFHNLTRLELATDWRFLSSFIENADNLEAIILLKVNIDSKCWMAPHQVSTCRLSHLRTVAIDQFECTEPELQLVKYILKNAKLLEKMEIYYQPFGIDAKVNFNAYKRISSFKTGSETCELLYHWAAET